MRIDQQRTVFRLSDADILEQAIHFRHAADGVKHLVDLKRATVIEVQAFAPVFETLNGHYIRIDVQIDAIGLHGIRNMLANIAIKAAQDQFATIELFDAHTEAVKNRGELASDI